MKLNAFTLSDFNVKGKTVLVRVDFNVPLKNGIVLDDTRIKAHLPTLNSLAKQGAKVVLVSHLGRPSGKGDVTTSLEPVAERLKSLISFPVLFAEDCIGNSAEAAKKKLNEGDILLLENVRYYKEEKANDSAFAEALATGIDLYINDAFANAHREHASMVGVPKIVRQNGIGLLMQQEMETLSKVLETPERPLLVVIGGSKISTKIGVLRSLIRKADQMMIGGAMANTFLIAKGHNIGRSLFEEDQIELARDILAEAGAIGCRIQLPNDVTVAQALEDDIGTRHVSFTAVENMDMILDIGPQTAENWSKVIAKAGTVLWNGPVGAFETPPFDAGTRAIAEAMAETKAFTVAGGGDTLAAVNRAGVAEKLDYLSTGGGALLELIEQGTLPALAALTPKTLQAKGAHTA